jgi:hypothetical protein
MIDDELELLGEQPRIDGMQDRAHARDGVVQLEVPVIVPGQRGDAVAGLHPGSPERVGQLACAAEDFAPVGAVPGIVKGDRDDLAVGVVPLCKPHDLGDEQRCIHHQAMHGPGPPRS